MIRKIVSSLLPFVVLALGVVVMIGLVRTKPRATKAPRDESGTLVEAIAATTDSKTVTVSAYGTVVPSREVAIAPEVNGKVTWVNQELLPGGYFSKGDVLLRLDGRDYKLAVDQQEATVDKARTELAVEESRKTIAEREWELMGKDTEGSPLALRDPQVKTARVAVAAAASGLERARLNIGRTVVRAPFNAVVQRRAVDQGQIIGPASPVLTLVGTDSFWVQISVPIDRLAWFDIPGMGGATTGSEATIWRELGGERVERKGRVIRLMTDVDPLGRMARVLVEIDDPLGLRDRRAGDETTPPRPSIPFLVGAFVQVDIHGRTVGDVVEIPRQALRDGDSVY
ncbi:MAG TPA: efflux RND transporter periplasmic adaptor subunit, partial [Kofleriaceae bacterium]|nr:efflux RND transporter periplasmic adaptor subunit [Kofleriaceae bacterium]